MAKSHIFEHGGHPAMMSNMEEFISFCEEFFAYGFNAIPLTILFGPDGTILKRDLRGEQISEAVKEALGV